MSIPHDEFGCSHTDEEISILLGLKAAFRRRWPQLTVEVIAEGTSVRNEWRAEAKLVKLRHTGEEGPCGERLAAFITEELGLTADTKRLYTYGVKRAPHHPGFDLNDVYTLVGVPPQ